MNLCVCGRFLFSLDFVVSFRSFFFLSLPSPFSSGSIHKTTKWALCCILYIRIVSKIDLLLPLDVLLSGSLCSTPTTSSWEVEVGPYLGVSVAMGSI